MNDAALCCANSRVFEPLRISSMAARNRLVRAAVHDGLANPDGSPSREQLAGYSELARGGAGAVITGYAYVRPDGIANPGMLGMHDDALIPRYRELANAIHDGGAVAIAQIVYAGSKCDPALLACSEAKGDSSQPLAGPGASDIERLAPDCVEESSLFRPLGPSAVENHKTGIAPVEASASDLHKLAEDFAAAALRAKAAGFDAVEIHAAHGYLLSQFLSPRFNRRADEYGGSVENRARFVVEVLRAVRHAVGDDFPILVKINSSDDIVDDANDVTATLMPAASGIEVAANRTAVLEAAPAPSADSAAATARGLSCIESLEIARLLAHAGADAIEVSGPWRAMDVRSRNGEPLFADYALELAESIDMPVILTGGCRELPALEALAAKGIAGFGLARPLICEPDLPHLWQRQIAEGDEPAPSRCISCDKCSKTPGCRCVFSYI